MLKTKQTPHEEGRDARLAGQPFDRRRSIAWQHGYWSVSLEDHTAPMSGEKYQKTLDTLGLSQVKASEFFGVSRKTSPRWARGVAPIPGAVAKLLRVMLHYNISPKEVNQLE